MNESEDHFRRIADSAPVMMWMVDTDRNYVFLNRKWLEFTGGTMEKHLGKGWESLIHTEDMENCLVAYHSAFTSQQPFDMEYRVQNSLGEYRWIRGHGVPHYCPENTFLGYVGTWTDVHESKTMGEELERRVALRTEELERKHAEIEQQKNLVEAIFNSSVDQLIVYDKDLKVIALNKKCEETHRIGQKDVLGKNILEVFPQMKNTKLYDDLEHSLQGESYLGKSYRSANPGKFFESNIIPLRRGDEVYAVLYITHDNTELVKASRQLRDTNRTLEQKNTELERSNNELAAFSYVASHDLKEPLRKVQTFGRIITEREKGLSATGRDYFMRMINATERMQRLIEALLEFSKITTQPVPVAHTNLGDLLDEVKKELDEEIRSKHAVIDAEELPDIAVIPYQFRQLLLNLLRNALKYTQPGQPPVIHVFSKYLSAAEINDPKALPDTDYLRICVRDEGIGFEPEQAEKIFELFHKLHGRSEYEGSGIGLAICKKVAENHHGFISALSQPGCGAEFNVYIPIHQE